MTGSYAHTSLTASAAGRGKASCFSARLCVSAPSPGRHVAPRSPAADRMSRSRCPAPADDARVLPVDPGQIPECLAFLCRHTGTTRATVLTAVLRREGDQPNSATSFCGELMCLLFRASRRTEAQSPTCLREASPRLAPGCSVGVLTTRSRPWGLEKLSPCLGKPAKV